LTSLKPEDSQVFFSKSAFVKKKTFQKPSFLAFVFQRNTFNKKPKIIGKENLTKEYATKQDDLKSQEINDLKSQNG
jgi:hypothetical protein